MQKQNAQNVGAGPVSAHKIGNTQKGITLIALVITIIILLILAGVTINMVLGDDGIIGQAQQAKAAQKEAQLKEEIELYKSEQELAEKTGEPARTVDKFIEDLLEAKIITKEEAELLDKDELVIIGNTTVVKDDFVLKSVLNNVKVGDYVTYIYTEAEYNTDDTADIGESQKFSSALSNGADEVKAAKVNAWRVLSKKDGIVKLVAESPNAYLTLRGANGWINGPTVLNVMCEKLYSGNMGTARSINVNDVNEITKYDGTKYYLNNDGETVTIPANETKTIGDLENDENLGLNMLEYRQTPDERNIAEYEANHYTYNPLDNNLLAVDDKEYSVLFGEETVGYWLASTSKFVRFDTGFVSFFVRSVTSSGVQGSILYASKGVGPGPFSGVLPLVTLKSGLEIEGGTGAEGDPWTIKQ